MPNILPLLRREGVLLAGLGLGLTDGKAAFGFVSPEALDVGQDGDDFLMAELVSEGGHTALVVGQLRYRSSLADDAVQETVGVVPGMTVAVEGRGPEGSIGILDVPVGLTFAVGAVAYGAIGGEYVPAGCDYGRIEGVAGGGAGDGGTPD